MEFNFFISDDEEHANANILEQDLLSVLSEITSSITAVNKIDALCEKINQFTFDTYLERIENLTENNIIAFIDLNYGFLSGKISDLRNKYQINNTINDELVGGVAVALELLKNSLIERLIIVFTSSSNSGDTRRFINDLNQTIYKKKVHVISSDFYGKKLINQIIKKEFWSDFREKSTHEIQRLCFGRKIHNDEIIANAIELFNSYDWHHDYLNQKGSEQFNAVTNWISNFADDDCSSKSVFLKRNSFGFVEKISSEQENNLLHRASDEIKKDIFSQLLVKLNIANKEDIVFDDLENKPYMRVPYTPLLKILLSLKSYIYKRNGLSNEKIEKVSFKQIEDRSIGIGVITLQFKSSQNDYLSFPQRYYQIVQEGFAQYINQNYEKKVNEDIKNVIDQHTCSTDLWKIINGITLDLDKDASDGLFFRQPTLFPCLTVEFGPSCVHLIWTYFAAQQNESM